MKRDLRFVVGALLFAFAVASPARAQSYPSVDGVEQFTASANFMSLPGYLRWRYYLDSGRWMSRDSVCGPVRDQIGTVPMAPIGGK